MNPYLAGVVAGLAAAGAWLVANLLTDFAFLGVIRRHHEQLNPTLMARPALNLLILAADLAFWGAIFGLGYVWVRPVLPGGSLLSGLLWGLLVFVPFSRALVENSLWTTVPRALNTFWLVEGLAGLATWGAVLGPLFAWLA